MTWLNEKDLTRLWYVAEKLGGINYGEASDEDKIINYLDRLSC